MTQDFAAHTNERTHLAHKRCAYNQNAKNFYAIVNAAEAISKCRIELITLL